MNKEMIIYHNSDFIYRCIFKYCIFSLSIFFIDMVIDEYGKIQILSKKGFLNKMKFNSEIINALKKIRVTKQNDYYFVKEIQYE